MGSFYANHALRAVDPERVVAVLDAARRRAWVATLGDASVVCDERCDAQDLDELRALAQVLARECAAPVLAACNHDDDVLWLALADADGVVDVYDSNPGYFDGRSDPPSVRELSRLCRAFGAADREQAIERLLREPHAGFAVEFERHQALCDLLALPSALASLGFRDLARGRPSLPSGAVTIRAAGGAPPLERGDEGAAESPAAVLFTNPRLGARAITWAALALADVDAPPELAPIVGTGRLNGLVVLLRLQHYLERHGLVHGEPAPGGQTIRLDPPLRRFFGADGFPYPELLSRTAAALGVESRLSPEERAALRAADPATQQRVERATEAAFRQAIEDRRSAGTRPSP